jgi:ABC-2 type transport system ATP-binding protein
MSICIETYNLSKRFPVTKSYRELILHPFKKSYVSAITDINIKIRKGELYGLLGPNGAGKTTLIKILCTLIYPTSGTAFLNGTEITKQGDIIKKKIGYVLSDERSFYWRLTGRQNLKFFAILNNISSREAEKRIDNLLEFLDLGAHADQMFRDYSTGMRRKLAIARGLINNPEIIFMDEPTSGLDPVISQKIRKLIKEKLVGHEKKTVIFATHNLYEAEELCDSIAVIHKGKIITKGPLEQIKTSFNTSKSYLMGLKDFKHSMLKSIQEIEIVNHVKPISLRSISDTFQIEIEMINNNGDGHRLLEEVLGLGCKISHFYEKQTSLENLFPKILSTEKDMIQGSS